MTSPRWELIESNQSISTFNLSPLRDPNCVTIISLCSQLSVLLMPFPPPVNANPSPVIRANERIFSTDVYNWWREAFWKWRLYNSFTQLIFPEYLPSAGDDSADAQVNMTVSAFMYKPQYNTNRRRGTREEGEIGRREGVTQHIPLAWKCSQEGVVRV